MRKKTHKAVGATLRLLGLLPKGYHLNDLTKNQKDRIRKIQRQFSGAVNHPEFFVKSKVSIATARELKARGVKTKGKVALFQKQGADSVRYDKRKQEIVREYKNKKGKVIKISRTILHKPNEIFNQAQKFFDNKKPGEHLMLRTGDKMPFGTAFYSMAHFEKYMELMWEQHEDDDGFFSQLYIIEVKNAQKTKAKNSGTRH